MLVQASTIAPKFDVLFWFLVAISLFITLGVAFFIVLFGVRYRRRSPDEIPPEIEGSNRLEIAWTVIPTVMALGVFVWAALLFIDMKSPPRNSMVINVIGRQWMWKAQQPTGQWENNELHVPVGVPVKLVLTSQDVIHSFFVPQFRVKQDAVPGIYSEMWFQATKPGVYDIFCAEYCGTQHSGMVGKVYALEPAQYEAWLSGEGGTAGAPGAQSPANQGAKLFQDLGCSSCHKAQGPGPLLNGVYGTQVQLEGGQTATVDDAYIRESILNPQAKVVKGFQPIMPTFKGQVSEAQILNLIAYIKSLSTSPGGQGNPAPGQGTGAVGTATSGQPGGQGSQGGTNSGQQPTGGATGPTAQPAGQPGSPTPQPTPQR